MEQVGALVDDIRARKVRAARASRAVETTP